MIIYEFRKDTPTVYISKTLLLDPGLTEYAKCTACVLLALPPESYPSIQTLAQIMNISKNDVACALRQLEIAGYITRIPRYVGGRYCGMSYIIYGCPKYNQDTATT